MRLGLLGGTFDPIHNGHLRVARTAAALGLECVALVPARRPPHKARGDIVGPFHRFAMAALATAGEEKLRVSTFELAREGPSYTIETVRHFAAAGHDVSLIMGSDSLVEIETWRECRALLDLAGAIVYPRRPILAPQLEQRLPDWVRLKWKQGSIVYVDQPPDDTSSSEIRILLRTGRPAGDLLPRAVAEYIAKHRLYTGDPEGTSD